MKLHRSEVVDLIAWAKRRFKILIALLVLDAFASVVAWHQARDGSYVASFFAVMFTVTACARAYNAFNIAVTLDRMGRK